MKKLLICILLAGVAAAVSCVVRPVHVDESLNVPAPIFPDYADCTIPTNIGPMNFSLTVPYDRAQATFASPVGEWTLEARGGQFTIPRKRWREMLAAARGGSISVRVSALSDGRWIAYAPFSLHVAPEPVDPYIAYRLIEPGYELWNRVGIYQYNLERQRQTPILENSSTGGSCMNCHSFANQDPDRMLLHLRGSVAATMLINDDKVERLNTKTPQTMSALVYPSWHPDGRFVAFSVNDTKQAYHTNDPNRVEVYDNASDIVLYDTSTHEIFTTPLLYDTPAFESFPTFSPDGRTLYFSSAPYVADVIENPEKVHYSLCSVSFDPDTHRFSDTVDTLYNARTEGRSASFPRVSPDGRYLLYTRSDYGGFMIWHSDSDLWMVDLVSGRHWPLTAANSPDAADSYHSWSSNGRWVVFSSRRLDGLYARPFIAYIDAEGQARKSFVAPQRDVEYYNRLMKSYNVPEFVKGRVRDRRRAISRMAKQDPGIDVGFRSQE